jgi:hypothetical protein
MSRRRNAIDEEERREKEEEAAARAEEARKKRARLERSAAELEELTRIELDRERRLLAQIPNHDFDPLLPLDAEGMYTYPAARPI